jgi:hypothetical protein
MNPARLLLFCALGCTPATHRLPVAPNPTAWTADETWAFNPASDDFRPDALLDLRYLNEKTAGESGFIKADANGDFLLGNGKPVRFWCALTDVGHEKPFTPRPLGRQTEPSLARHARFLAKRGVNMIRLHTALQPGPDQAVTSINEGTRDWIWRTVAAMKKEGIYSTISPYWAIPVKVGKGWGMPGADQPNATGLLFFEPKLQQAYWGWLKQLYSAKNPYTGLTLAEDPSVAVIQLQNEDSLLFWTINSLKGQVRTDLQKQFGDWLAKKYGSLSAATARWADVHQAGDNYSLGLVDFFNVWDMTQSRSGTTQKRLADQTEFWTWTMREFNRKTEAMLRSIGCKQLVNAGNWRTADSARLLSAERYSYEVNAVDAVNRYFTGVHKGPAEGWNIKPGDKFTSESALRDPSPLPTSLMQTQGHPMLITESSWVMPNGYASEAPFLISAYQSLNGVDGYFWFATSDDEWTQPQSGNGYDPGQAKWLFGNPDMLGTFPGAALMYRQSYVKRGEPVVVEHRSLQNVWDRNVPLVVEEGGFDPNRDMGDVAPTSSVKTAVDPLAFLVGPVMEVFNSDPAKTKAMNLKPFIDRGTGAVKSATGELTLNYTKGFCTVNSPLAQGVTAFFGSQSGFSLADTSFFSENEYGAALAVSMDGLPLKTSKKVLVQYGTRCRPTGWAEKVSMIDLDGGKKTSGFEVIATGKAPWRVKSAKLDVTVRNQGLSKATVLDMNGNAVGPVAVKKSAAGLSFRFPDSAMYVVLQ